MKVSFFRKRLNFLIMVVTGTLLTLSGTTAAATAAAGTLLGGIGLPLAVMLTAGYGINRALDGLQYFLERHAHRHWILRLAADFHRARRVITGVLVGAALAPFLGASLATIWGLTAIALQRPLMNYHNQRTVKYNRWNLLLNSLAIISAIAAPYLGLAGLAGRAATALMCSGSALAAQYRGFEILKNINLLALTGCLAVLSLMHKVWDPIRVAICIRLAPYNPAVPGGVLPSNFILCRIVRLLLWLSGLNTTAQQLHARQGLIHYVGEADRGRLRSADTVLYSVCIARGRQQAQTQERTSSNSRVALEGGL